MQLILLSNNQLRDFTGHTHILLMGGIISIRCVSGERQALLMVHI